MEWESFLCLEQLSYCFLSLKQFLTLYSLHFQYRDTSSRFSLMWVSAGVTFFWTSSPFPWQPLSSFMSITKISSCICTVSWMVRLQSHIINIRMLSYFFYNSISIQFKFHVSLDHFLFTCCFFIFFLWFPTLTLHFCKILYGFIPGKQGDNTTTHFSVCVWTEEQRCRDHSPTDF